MEDSENAVRKAGGTFPCIQIVFLSIMNGRGKLWWAGIVVSAFSRARGGRAEDFAALPGYAQTTNGSYVYFELSSSEKLSEQQVDLEIVKAFGNSGASEIQAC